MKTFHDEVKEELDGVGCGMCLAKWTQVTMHLHNGMTHSCHHPNPHKIPLDELKLDYKALHNTNYKKARRLEMLEGKKPKECDYCWNVEDNSNSFSDRVFKSAEPWSYPFLNEIKSLDHKSNYNPRYVEVSFSNTCNFKCAYCGPMFSSKWIEEIEKFGPYKAHNFGDLTEIKDEDKLPYKHSEENPYVEAFWKWWPEMYQDLHTFRITGGEPLLSKDTWKVLDYIIETDNQNPKLNLSIYTNLGVPSQLIDKLIEKIKTIIKEKRVNEIILFTSVDTYGEQAEYLRYGLNFNSLWANIRKILTEIPEITITIMSTFNILSVFSYDMLIDEVYSLKKEFKNDLRYWKTPIILDTSYLRHPQFLSVLLLEDRHKNMILKLAEKVMYLGVPKFENKYHGFSGVEVQKIKRIYDYASQTIIEPDELKELRKTFTEFITEYDQRKGLNFIETFPELKSFYKLNQ
jgi:organic radical activating enzyme